MWGSVLECDERCEKVLRDVWVSVLGCGEGKGRCGEVCWSVGGGAGKCWERFSVWRGVGKCVGCVENCWGVYGNVGGGVGKFVGVWGR